MVKDLWESSNVGESPIEKWQNKIRRLMQYLRGWSRDQSSKYKIEKEVLLKQIDELDIKSKSVPLSEPERAAKKKAETKLASLRWDDEFKWAQLAKL
jgi:hypothetical protein